MNMILGVVGIAALLALVIFPEVRKKLKVLCGGFLNIFVTNAAKTPKGAEAVYQQAIEEVEKKYEQSKTTMNRLVGERESLQRKLYDLQTDLKDTESKCESLVRKGDIENAMLFSDHREEVLIEIEQKQRALVEINNGCSQAKAVFEAYEKKLRSLKKEKKRVVEELIMKNNMKDLMGDLDDLSRTSATDKLLGAVQDHVEDLRKEVDGAVAVHAAKTSTKIAMAEKKAASAQSSSYLQGLMNKYGTQQSLPGSTGVVYQIPQTTKTPIKEERK